MKSLKPGLAGAGEVDDAGGQMEERGVDELPLAPRVLGGRLGFRVFGRV